MLTRETYLWAVFQARCWRAAGIISLIAFPWLGFLAAGSWGAPLMQVFAAMFSIGSAQLLRSAVLVGGMMLGLVVHLFCLLLSLSDSRLRCPCCRRLRTDTKLALATEHCETCGQPIPFLRPLNATLEAAPKSATPDDPSLPSVKDFLRDLQKYASYSRSVVGLPTLSILLVSIVLVFGVSLYRRTTLPRVPVNAIERCLIFASIFSPPLLYGTVATMRWQRPPLLTCRRCRRTLVGRSRHVIASRHCPRCGVRVLRDGE